MDYHNSSLDALIFPKQRSDTKNKLTSDLPMKKTDFEKVQSLNYHFGFHKFKILLTIIKNNKII